MFSRVTRRSLLLGSAAVVIARPAIAAAQSDFPEYMTPTSFESQFGFEITWGEEWEPSTMASFSLEGGADTLVLSLGGPFGAGSAMLNITLSPSISQAESDPAAYLWEQASAAVPEGKIWSVDDTSDEDSAALIYVIDSGGDFSTVGYRELRLPRSSSDPLIEVHLSCRAGEFDHRDLARGLESVAIDDSDAITVMDRDDVLDELEQAAEDIAG